MSGAASPISPGNSMPIRNIPVGSVIHCVELKPGKGAQFVRSAGTSCQLVAREGNYATLRLRSEKCAEFSWVAGQRLERLATENIICGR